MALLIKKFFYFYSNIRKKAKFYVNIKLEDKLDNKTHNIFHLIS